MFLNSFIKSWKHVVSEERASRTVLAIVLDILTFLDMNKKVPG